MQDSAAKIHFRLHSTKRPEGEQGRSDVQDSGVGRLPRVTQVMALAVQFQDMLQRGEARDYADLPAGMRQQDLTVVQYDALMRKLRTMASAPK